MEYDFRVFLIMPPAYYKYGDEEVIDFYSRIIEAVPDSRIILYNFEKLCGYRFSIPCVEELVKKVEEIKNNKTKIDDQVITEVLTVNGVRFSFEDGSWGLIRASSNKPSLVIVTESPTSDDRKKKIFDFIDDLLQKTGKIGEYDQKI